MKQIKDEFGAAQRLWWALKNDSDRGESFSSDESGDQVLDLSRARNRGLRSAKDQIINSKVRDDRG